MKPESPVDPIDRYDSKVRVHITNTIINILFSDRMMSKRVIKV